MTWKQQPFPVPHRIRTLRDDLFACENSVCFERAQIYTASHKRTNGAHPALRRAQAMCDVFDQMSLFIRPGELIVGQRTSRLGARAVYPEYHLSGLEKNTTPPEIWDYWQGDTLKDHVARSLPESVRLVEAEMASGHPTGAGSGFGHVIVDYGKVLRVGFRAIIREAEAQLADNQVDGGSSDKESTAFLQSVIASCEGIVRWAKRYAALAEQEAETCPDPERAAELRQIAQTCRHVPEQPARSYREALQSFWFAHLAMHIEQYGWSISAGRFDQYVYPYYRHDLDTGVIDAETAWELLLNLWVKFMENVGTEIKETIFQNLTLGGQDLEGNDQSNELSHLCLEATLALRVNQPALSVRWHPHIDPGFWSHVHEMLAEGLGLPALFSDDVIIPALETHGVSHADAVDYGLVGCVESCVPGKMQGVTAGGHINLAKALELALNEGKSMITGRQIGESTTAPETWQGFLDLWESYATQVRYLCNLNVLSAVISGEAQKRLVPCPLMSALLDDCIAQERDLVCGGTRYNLPGTGIFGPSNVADAMVAMRRRICREERITWGALRKALLDDYDGHEPIRRMLSEGVPRFGNDQAEVDEMTNRINAIHAECLWQHVDARNGRFTSGVWPVINHVTWGEWTAATPDGRRGGEPLVDGVGASQGADLNGPTALLRSVAKLDNVNHWSAGNTCNIKFGATTLSGQDGAARLAQLTEGFMRLGGQELQINVVDLATLRDAQQHPEQHQDLIVRVAGFSAYFTQLRRDVQEEIMARTEHGL